MSIEDFTSKLFSTGLARTNRWQVFIEIPEKVFSKRNLGIQKSELKDEMKIFSNSATIPGRSLATFEAYQHRRPVKLPYQRQMEDVSINFILNENYFIRKLFESWVQYPINEENNMAKYISEYSTNVIIEQLNIQDEVIFGIKLIKAYPISFQSIELDQSENSFETLNVTFTYFNYEINNERNPVTLIAQNQTNINQNISTIQNIA